jgi:hypothetical protein
MGEALTRHSLRPLAFRGPIASQASGVIRHEIANVCLMLFEM